MAEFEIWWWCWPVLPWVAWGEFWTLCGLLAAWGWSTGATQVAAPLGEVLRSAGSRRGRSEWQNSRFGGGGGVGYLGLPGGSFGPHLGSKRQGKWQNRLQPLYGGSLGVLGAGCCGLNRRFCVSSGLCSELPGVTKIFLSVAPQVKIPKFSLKVPLFSKTRKYLNPSHQKLFFAG